MEMELSTINAINKNYICERMTRRDVQLAFNLEESNLSEQIYALIGKGYIKRTGDRYFSLTESLLDKLFLSEGIKLTNKQIKFLNRNYRFTRKDIVYLFGGGLRGEQVMKKLIAENYFVNEREWVLTDKFIDLLEDGKKIIN